MNTFDSSTIDFPLSFSIIINPGLSDTALDSNGYRNTFQYFLGLSDYSADYYGWAGHTEEGGSISNVSGNI